MCFVLVDGATTDGCLFGYLFPIFGDFIVYCGFSFDFDLDLLVWLDWYVCVGCLLLFGLWCCNNVVCFISVMYIASLRRVCLCSVYFCCLCLFCFVLIVWLVVLFWLLLLIFMVVCLVACCLWCS